MARGFLPVNMKECRALGWDAPDFVYVTGDAYVDHPSFGLAIISRVLEKAGYRVAMLPQPDWHSCEPFKAFGRPKIGFLVTAGVIDSMVNHYTAAKKRRSEDAYAPGGEAGHRPDRATIVYCNRIREAYRDAPIAIGGVEASLRRFAHYDYWDDRVRNSMLVDSGADVLMFGMGERSILKVAEWMRSGRDFSEMRVPGTCVMAGEVPGGFIEIQPMEVVSRDKRAYAEAFKVQYDQQDPVRGKPIAQKHGKKWMLQNVPDMPLREAELDAVYALPYMRSTEALYVNQDMVEKLGYEVPELEYGPGFPAAYFVGEEFDETSYLAEFSQLLEGMRNRLPITLELGRGIAASCGSFLSRVADVKCNHKEHYAILDSGIHHLTYYGQFMAMKHPVCEVWPPRQQEEGDTVWNLCGSLCTTNDLLVKKLPVHDLKIGDVLVFHNTGAYSMTEGISLFLSRDLPAVVWMKENGEMQLLRQAQPVWELNSGILQ